MVFFCIADKESSLGFRLTGVETREVTTGPQALEAFKVALAMDEVGVILITEKAARFIRPQIEEYTYRNQLPLILEISSAGLKSTRKSAGEFLKEAIGIGI